MQEQSTSALLVKLSEGDPKETVSLDAILQRFNRRAFGVLLLMFTLPAFLPLPAGAGAISGPLVVLLGLQMLFGLRRPWFPQRWRQRGVRRERFARFSQRMSPWLLRVERLVKPRVAGVFTTQPAPALTGLMLAILGLLLSLPIPLTNYPLGLLILFYAIALIERDGVFLIVLWLVGIAACIALISLGDNAWQWAQQMWG
ncbi:exopolysaccharide biosynthesis protein [Pseudomarimonas arenosa]|uniref:Exopolysaccharide biosynthesis protein n=1 Tax=Pseudomarimonas arenosa TaxID=2774145 RepID=A0AAW3ZRM6_9GAMM|nr:exopolysaccharide biosynthesis protein [Pseudomarimonas arenosa]MBD8527724.1 exopolysaccharide biosynthesis protein [Pseudomarimonas arenosa]